MTNGIKDSASTLSSMLTCVSSEASRALSPPSPAILTAAAFSFQPLDFERAAEMRLSIRVENELPYFSCRVKEKMQSGLWKVDTSTDAGPQPQAFKVLIKVEDANDPPEFSVGVKEVRLEENVANGTWVEKFPASDFDSTFVYARFVLCTHVQARGGGGWGWGKLLY